MAQMPLRVEILADMGMGIEIKFSAERIIDDDDEAKEFGNDMRELTGAFSEGYGSGIP
jgi:hypothetical protein